MGISRGKTIVTDGLVLALDAANPKSYPGTGTEWGDLSDNGSTTTLINGPAFNSDYNGGIYFDGSNDYATISNLSADNWAVVPFTLDIWCSSFLQFYSLFELAGSGGTNWGLQTYKTNNSSNLLYTYWISSYGNGGMACSSDLFSSPTTPINITITFTGIGGTSQSTLYSNTFLKVNNQQTTKIFGGGAAIGTHSSLRLGGGNYKGRSTISSVKMYNRVLSNDELTQNYNATKGRFGL